MYLKNKKVALVHDYLVQYGGAEKTLEAILELFPLADIYTSLYNPKNMPETITKRKVVSLKDTPFGNIPLIKEFPKIFTILMPWVFESFDLSAYDLVISDGTAWAKSVLTTPDQLHISYVHTPPRFLYGYTVESQRRNAWYAKPFVMVVDHFLRIWDFYAAQRPDFLLTNSKETQARIKKFYGREALVIYPPVDVDYKTTGTYKDKDYYLVLGRLAAYKNTDMVIKAFEGTNLKLVVAGTGTEEAKLKTLSGPNVTFTGRVDEETKHQLLDSCKGLIFPVELEDFGIVPVECLAHGKPVLAHRSGGVKETVNENVTGMFFEELSSEALRAAVLDFDSKINAGQFKPEVIKESVKGFSKQRFLTELQNFVESKGEKHGSTTADDFGFHGQ